MSQISFSILFHMRLLTYEKFNTIAYERFSPFLQTFKIYF